ncbi:MAG TPA: biotin/lipoyl-binding protein [Verrucomicrobiales bacterium]|nr:biotin/lipoyl-binding protein [Verrucomicrobiales bacterium]
MSSSRQMPDYAVREIEVTRPCLREGLRWTFQEIGGEGSYLLEDPLAGRFYRLGQKEYEFARRLNGRHTVADLVARAAKGDPEMAFEAGDATSLIRMLIDSGLVTTDDSDHAERVWDEINRPHESNRMLGKMSQLMFLKIPLCNPDRFFAWIAAKLGWVASPVFVVVWLAVVIWGIASVHSDRERFAAQMSGLFDFGNFWMLGGLWLGLKVFHECWHGLVCRKFGGAVPEAGVTLLLLTTPLGYVNASSSIAFPSKWQRIAVSVAGIYGELLMAALAAIIWTRVEPGVLSGALHQVVVLSSVTTLLFNANPLMRFDGYYILSDLLDIPNLYAKGQKVSQWIFRRRVLGMKKAKFPLAKSERRILITLFGLAAAIWRVLVVAGLLVATAFLFKGAGLLLAVLAAAIMAVQSLAGMARYLKKSAAAEGLRPARLVLRVVMIVTAATAALFLIRVTPTAKAPAVVQDVSGGTVRVDCPGFLTRMFVSDGDHVEKGDLLARLENVEAMSRLLQLETEIERSRVYRDQLLERGDIAASQAESENLASLEGIAKELRYYTSSLELRAPRSGTIDGRHLDLLLDTWIEPGRLLLSVAGENQKELVILAAAEDRESFEEARQANRPVTFQPRGRWQIWQAALKSTVPRASLEVPHFALIAPGQGPLPVKRRGGGGQPSNKDEVANREASYELTRPRFEIRADLAEEADLVLRDGEMGMVVAKSSDASSLGALGLRRFRLLVDQLIEKHAVQ